MLNCVETILLLQRPFNISFVLWNVQNVEAKMKSFAPFFEHEQAHGQ